MDSLFSWSGLLPAVLVAVIIIIGVVIFRSSRRKKPEEPRYVEALSALLAGNEDRAIEDLRQTVRVERSNIDAYLRLGNLLRKKGHIERALRIHRDLDVGTFFRRKLTDREKARIREAIADDFLAARRPDEALAVLADLLRRDKSNTRIRRKMVAVYERLGAWDKAFGLHQEGFRVRKEKAPERVARYRAFCGTAYLDAGDSATAARVFEEVLRIDPTCPEALFRLGGIRFDNGDLHEAIGFWERFHEASPELAHLTFENFERALFETGDLNKMEKVYKAILEKQPNHNQTLLSLSAFYARRGETDEAIVEARRAADKHPASAEALARLMSLYSRSDSSSDACREISETIADRKSAEIELCCSRCGHTSDKPFWRCPKCLDWYTARPRTTYGSRTESSAPVS